MRRSLFAAVAFGVFAATLIAPGTSTAAAVRAVFCPEDTDLFIDTPSGQAPFTNGQILGQLGLQDPEVPMLFASDAPADLLQVNNNGQVVVTDADALYQYIKDNDGLTVNVSGFDGDLTYSTQILLGKKGYGPSQGQMYIEADDGTIYTPRTKAEFIAALQDMKNNGTHIKKMILKGHGGSGGIQIGEDDDFLTVGATDINVGDVNPTDITQLLKDVTNGDSVISVRGCSTVDFAKELQDLLNNGTTVWGSIWYAIGIPGTYIGIGIYR